MQYDQFVHQVQHRARVSSSGEAIKAIHATLETLGERLQPGAAKNLGAQLPSEIAHYLDGAAGQESFDAAEFYERVCAREGTGLHTGIFHARAVISVLQDAVSPGEMEDIRASLPRSYAPLFESGSEGQMTH
ncbi:DUF2267 domain-containing protein [Guyparkeria sp.]|uniref:DUF2267 domain-containing protein n=1 Tax=Guyparkeria sp. TaxID=2035736 RepID=UPI003970BECF